MSKKCPYQGFYADYAQFEQKAKKLNLLKKKRTESQKVIEDYTYSECELLPEPDL
jgi:hypothetical protein